MTDEERRAKKAAQARAWRAANPEAARENNRRSVAKNRDALNEARRLRRAANPEKAHERELWKNYRIKGADYKVMLAAQEGCCAICSRAKPGGNGKNFHVDHDHVTGKVRGLLCSSCNQGLGRFQDNPVLLERAAIYLKKSWTPSGSHESLFPRPLPPS